MKESGREYLKGLNGSGIRLGLEKITELMKRLGNPEQQLKIIHVAGTNGKGSVSQMIGTVLIEAGYKIGAFNSPYLITPNECITINHKPISNEDFDSYLNKVQEVVEKMNDEGINPSYFEVLTAVVFLYFRDQGVDFLILEVGLGGASDATNVIKESILSVITKISIDHKDFLGNTLAEIAAQKAGIIKERGLVITPFQEKEVNKAIEVACKKHSANLYYMKPYELELLNLTEAGTRFSYKEEIYELQLIGSYQVYNAALAIEALRLLKSKGYIELTEEILKKGLKKTFWPGRFEKVCNKPLVFIDGAHNVDGITALRDTICCFKKSGYRIGIVGILRDKEVESMIKMISPIFDELIVVTPDSDRAMPLDTMVQIVSRYHHKVFQGESIEAGIQMALNRAMPIKDSTVIAFGSLYMIGEVRRYFMDKH